MTITIEVLLALAAVIVFAVDAYLHKSLTALGLFCLGAALMFHFGIRIAA